MVDPELQAWNERTAGLLEEAYVAAGPGPGGSGSNGDAADWEGKRRVIAEAFHRSGTWLNVGCANGFLLATLPTWVAEQGHVVEPSGLELLPKVADLARRCCPELAPRIHTGDAMSWEPPCRYTFVTVLDDAVPPGRLGDLVDRLLGGFVEPGGRLVVSRYAGHVDLVDDLAALGHVVSGSARSYRSDGTFRTTAWLEAPS